MVSKDVATLSEQLQHILCIHQCVHFVQTWPCHNHAETKAQEISGMIINIPTITTIVDIPICTSIVAQKAAKEEDAEVQMLRDRGWPHTKVAVE